MKVVARKGVRSTGIRPDAARRARRLAARMILFARKTPDSPHSEAGTAPPRRPRTPPIPPPEVVSRPRDARPFDLEAGPRASERRPRRLPEVVRIRGAVLPHPSGRPSRPGDDCSVPLGRRANPREVGAGPRGHRSDPRGVRSIRRGGPEASGTSFPIERGCRRTRVAPARTRGMIARTRATSARVSLRIGRRQNPPAQDLDSHPKDGKKHARPGQATTAPRFRSRT